MCATRMSGEFLRHSQDLLRDRFEGTKLQMSHSPSGFHEDKQKTLMSISLRFRNDYGAMTASASRRRVNLKSVAHHNITMEYYNV